MNLLKTVKKKINSIKLSRLLQAVAKHRKIVAVAGTVTVMFIVGAIIISNSLANDSYKYGGIVYGTEPADSSKFKFWSLSIGSDGNTYQNYAFPKNMTLSQKLEVTYSDNVYAAGSSSSSLDQKKVSSDSVSSELYSLRTAGNAVQSLYVLDENDGTIGISVNPGVVISDGVDDTDNLINYYTNHHNGEDDTSTSGWEDIEGNKGNTFTGMDRPSATLAGTYTYYIPVYIDTNDTNNTTTVSSMTDKLWTYYSNYISGFDSDTDKKYYADNCIAIDFSKCSDGTEIYRIINGCYEANKYSASNPNGWRIYDAENEIPLYSDGKKLSKVYVLTANRVFFYNSVTRSDASVAYSRFFMLLYEGYELDINYINRVSTPVISSIGISDVNEFSANAASSKTGAVEISVWDTINLASETGTVPQYYFSDTYYDDPEDSVNGIKEEDWLNKTGTSNTCSIELKDYGKKYLYVRSFYNLDNNTGKYGNGACETSHVVCQELDYLSAYSQKVTYSVQDNSLVNQGDEIKLTATGDNSVFYVAVYGDKVNDFDLKSGSEFLGLAKTNLTPDDGTETLVGNNLAVQLSCGTVVDGGVTYYLVKMNGIWYKMYGAGGNIETGVISSGSSYIISDKLDKDNNVLCLYTFGLSSGQEPADEAQSYTYYLDLAAPYVMGLSGNKPSADSILSIPTDDYLQLSTINNRNATDTSKIELPSGAEALYYFSDTKITGTGTITGWNSVPADSYVANGGYDYICTRYAYTANDGVEIKTTPVWTQLNYYKDALMSRRVTVKSDGIVLMNGSVVSLGHKINFTKSNGSSKVFYFADYDNSVSEVTLTELDPTVASELALIETLGATASTLAEEIELVQLSGVSYLRINGIWYEANAVIAEYTSDVDSAGGFTISSDILKNCTITLYTLEVLADENPQKSFTSAIYPAALKTPDLYVMNYSADDSGNTSGTEKNIEKPGSDTVREVTVASDSMISLKNAADNGTQGSIQYYFSSIAVNDTDSISGWITYDGAADNGWIDLPESGIPVYLYVRTYYSDVTSLGVTPTGNYPVDCYKLIAYGAGDSAVSVSISGKTASMTSNAGTTIYYAVGPTEPVLSVVKSFPSNLGSSSENKTKYILVNGVLYESTIELTKVVPSELSVETTASYTFPDSVMSSNVYAIAVKEGVEPEDGYNFSYAGYMNVSLGSVVRIDFESDYASGNSSGWENVSSERDFKNSKSKDDSVRFYIKDNSGIDSSVTTAIQYYMSSTKLDNTSSINNWVTASDNSFVSIAGNAYIYTRLYVDGVGYSDAVCWKISLLPEAENVITYSPVSGSSMDVGTEIKASAEVQSASGISSSAGLMLYSTDQTGSPTLTKVSYSERISKKLDVISGGTETADTMAAKSANGTSYIIEYENKSGNENGDKSVKCYYIRLNNLWYKTDGVITLKEGNEISAEADSLLRTYNVFSLYVLPLADIGIEPDSFNVARYTYAMDNQVPTPISTPTTPDADGNAVVIDVGDVIYISFESAVPAGTKIFYTLNGAVPVIEIGDSGLVAGTNTYLYDSSAGIKLTNSMGTSGEILTISAQGVYYTQQENSWYRVYNDSNVARLSYQIGELEKVATITSVPATTSDSPETVIPGTRIQLSTSTPNAEIYYTIDGSEPTYIRSLDADEKYVYSPGPGTLVYNKGVAMPEHDGTSTYFTITAIGVATDMQPSDFCKFVFAYPSVVSAPYSTPGEGAVTENTEVSLATATSGALIYYEIAYGDDIPADPTTASNIFATGSSLPFKITKKTTIKAFAVKDGMSSAISTFTYTVADKLSVPTPSVTNGSVVSSGTILTLSSTAGATVYYTIDGSDPKLDTNKNVMIGTSLVLTGEAGTAITVRTYAAKTGYSDSDSGVYTYTVSAYEGGVYADKETGSTLKSGTVVRLSTDVTGATIYYTTDGSIPTINSAKGNAVTINGEPGENVTLLAFALVSGTTTSTGKGTFIYTIMDQLAAPSFSVPDGAIFTEEATLTLSSEKGSIYYTTDGSTPSTGSNLYRSGIKITGPVTIKAIAVSDDMETSEISTCTYGFAEQVKTPVCSNESGELEVGTQITFETETEGAEIYYRTDGKTPDPNDTMTTTRYSGPVTIEKATNFKVIAVKEHMQDSAVLSVGFTVKEVEIPVVEETEETTDVNTNGRLQSRRDYMTEAEGPSYSDVVMKNAVYGVVLSSDEGVIEDDVELVVETVAKTDTEEKQVRSTLGSSYEISQVYDVKLYKNGEEIQPDGTIEIGIPIPEENENSIVELVHILDNGTVAVCETRRSGGIAYAKVDSLSNFALAAPTVESGKSSSFPIRPVLYGLTATLVIGGALLIYHANKKRKEESENE